MATEHSFKATSWITVGLIVVASILLGLAMVVQSVPLAVLGGIVGIGGVITGAAGRIMDDAH